MRVSKRSDRKPLPPSVKMQLCYLCSLPLIESTREHIFSRQFFLPDELEAPPVLLACRACNQAKARDEEYVYPYLILTYSSYFAKRQNSYFFNEVVRPFFRKLDSDKQQKGLGLMLTIYNYMQAAKKRGRKWYTEPQIQLDPDRLYDFYSRIGKGLFTLAIRRVVQWNEYEIYVTDERSHDEVSRGVLGFGYHSATYRDSWGDSLLHYGGYVQAEKETTGLLWSSWTIGFYNAHAIGIALYPKAMVAN